MGLRHPRTQLGDRLFPVHLLGSPSMLGVGGLAPLDVCWSISKPLISAMHLLGPVKGGCPAGRNTPRRQSLQRHCSHCGSAARTGYRVGAVWARLETGGLLITRWSGPGRRSHVPRAYSSPAILPTAPGLLQKRQCELKSIGSHAPRRSIPPSGSRHCLSLCVPPMGFMG